MLNLSDYCIPVNLRYKNMHGYIIIIWKRERRKLGSKKYVIPAFSPCHPFHCRILKVPSLLNRIVREGEEKKERKIKLTYRRRWVWQHHWRLRLVACWWLGTRRSGRGPPHRASVSVDWRSTTHRTRPAAFHHPPRRSTPARSTDWWKNVNSKKETFKTCFLNYKTNTKKTQNMGLSVQL